MWRSRRDLANDYGISTRTVDRIINEIIRPRIGKDYPPDTEIYVGNRIRIDRDAFHDALLNREAYRWGLK